MEENYALWPSMKSPGSAPAKCVARWNMMQKHQKNANIIRAHCSPEKITQKYQLSIVHAACIPINWPKDLQKYDIYINEEGMYELLFSSQQSKTKDFRRHCCNVLFPHVLQQLSDKLHAMEIEDLTSRVQVFEFTNEEEG